MAGAQLIATPALALSRRDKRGASVRIITDGGSVLYYLHTDHLGSTSLTTCGTGCGTAGTLVARQLYDAWGNVRYGGGLPTDISFTGQRADTSTNLLYFKARYYSNAVGRFISADTIVPDGKNPQQFNRYAYGLNNPIKYRDPSGHAADAGGAGGGICDEHCRRVYQQLAQQAYQLAEAVGGMTDLSAPVTYQLTIYFQTIAIKYEHLSEGDSVTALNQQGAENSLHQWLAINGVFGDYAARQAESDALVPVYAVGSLQMNNNLSALYRNWALQDMPSSMASSSMASGAAPCNSFSGDTLVATDEGEQPIVTLRIGDVVLAYNEGLGRTGWYTVTGVWVHDDPVIEYVTIDGERIETTPEHPFFTEEYGWQSAVELRIGTHVRNADGNYGVVQTIQFAFRTQPMYNLTVEGAHTFFVGQHQWLVHNQCPLSAYQVADYVERNGGNPPPGYRGGTVFQNDGRGGGQRLSSLDVDGNRITYREYDVNPYAPGVNRGAERIVIGSDGSRYYTNDHYTTFTPF